LFVSSKDIDDLLEKNGAPMWTAVVKQKGKERFSANFSLPSSHHQHHKPHPLSTTTFLAPAALPFCAAAKFPVSFRIKRGVDFSFALK
jgi:hypothetical protein